MISLVFEVEAIFPLTAITAFTKNSKMLCRQRTESVFTDLIVALYAEYMGDYIKGALVTSQLAKQCTLLIEKWACYQRGSSLVATCSNIPEIWRASYCLAMQDCTVKAILRCVAIEYCLCSGRSDLKRGPPHISIICALPWLNMARAEMMFRCSFLRRLYSFHSLCWRR